MLSKIIIILLIFFLLLEFYFPFTFGLDYIYAVSFTSVYS